MQGRVRHGGSADKHRLEAGYRRNCTSSPNLKLHIPDPGDFFLGREFACDRPPRCPRYKTEPVLQTQ